jgi:hypothetical protein
MHVGLVVTGCGDGEACSFSLVIAEQLGTTATLVKNDPGLLGRNDPRMMGDAVGDPRRRCEEEATVLDLPPMVSG